MAAIEPHAAIARRFGPLMRVGGLDVISFANSRYLRPVRNGGAIPEVMNHPDIKDAMYAPLAGISDEYFVPNLHLIPNNTLAHATEPAFHRILYGGAQSRVRHASCYGASIRPTNAAAFFGSSGTYRPTSIAWGATPRR